MSVYVDNMRAPHGRMIMCHMFADTHDELVDMADRIGVARRWIQVEGTHREHFDVSLAKRALAVQHGAEEITMHELSRLLNEKRRASTPDSAVSTPELTEERA